MESLEKLATRWFTHLVVERGLSDNTLQNYRRDVHRYCEFLEAQGISELSAVTRADVESYVQFLRSGDTSTGVKPLAASSAARALVVARGWHKFCVEEGLLEHDVAAEVSPPKTARNLPDTLSPEEVLRIIDAIPEDDAATPVDIRDRAVIELLYATGMRISEAMQLTLDAQVDIANGLLRVHGKGDKQRIVPVGSHAQEAVSRYLVRSRPQFSNGKSHALFLNTRGGTLSRQSVWQMLQERARRAEISAKISPHTLRHCFATHLMEGGANVRVVQELLGHASVTTTQIYTHVTADNLRSVWATSHPRA